MTIKLSYRKDDRAMRPMYKGALNFRGVPDNAHGHFFQKFLIVPIEHINVHAKFEIGSFTRSRDNSD